MNIDVKSADDENSSAVSYTPFTQIRNMDSGLLWSRQFLGPIWKNF